MDTPLGYNVRVLFENKLVEFVGAITYDAGNNHSPECQTRANVDPPFNYGYYIGTITCTCCGADLSFDPNNCGQCGNVCSVDETCQNGKCLGQGQIEVTSSWNKLGDMNL